jgi:hypothetical protein
MRALDRGARRVRRTLLRRFAGDEHRVVQETLDRSLFHGDVALGLTATECAVYVSSDFRRVSNTAHPTLPPTASAA